MKAKFYGGSLGVFERDTNGQREIYVHEEQPLFAGVVVRNQAQRAIKHVYVMVDDFPPRYQFSRVEHSY
jgi:hypothetical protein